MLPVAIAKSLQYTFAVEISGLGVTTMKSIINKAFFLLALLPIMANADISSDMANSELSLAQVVQNAQAEGLDMDAIVTQMIAADPAQSSSIVAAAMVVAPNSFGQIVSAAVRAGADPSSVASAALVANNNSNQAGIVNAIVAAVPPSQRGAVRASVNQAAARVTSTTGAVNTAAARAIRVAATTARGAGGGGAASTADEIQDILETREELEATIASVRESLVAAGIDSADVEAGLQAITNSLRDQQTSLDSIATSLTALKTQISQGATTEEILAGLDDAIASASS